MNARLRANRRLWLDRVEGVEPLTTIGACQVTWSGLPTEPTAICLSFIATLPPACQGGPDPRIRSVPAGRVNQSPERTWYAEDQCLPGDPA
jgi:hypothetical protein